MPGGDLWGGCLCVPTESGSPALTILATALALCAINSLFPTRVAYDTSPHHLATLLLIFAMMARLARGFSVGNSMFCAAITVSGDANTTRETHSRPTINCSFLPSID